VLKLRNYFDPNDDSVNPDCLNTALVVLPNGCGKTGVAVLASYALSASRALVITPSTIVSEQVYDAYKHFLLDRKIITDDELDEFLPSIATISKSSQILHLETTKVVNAPTVAVFKQKLDDFWHLSGYGHSQRPAA